MACVGAASVTAAVFSWTSCCSSSETRAGRSGHASIQARDLSLNSRVNLKNGAFQERRDEIRLPRRMRRCASSDPTSSPNEGVYLPDLAVPKAWVSPEVAADEAEWLRIALQNWLDDEYCPEPANAEISRRCSKVYYYCLLEEQLDVGDILMQMVRDLETFSFKESFHGAFSSANAAIDLITKRMRAREASSFN